jgi:hypothetical protein
MALPREQYLASALTRAKPWEAMGMSRATWYRKGKPEPSGVGVRELNRLRHEAK